jgi:hypothetical protein
MAQFVTNPITIPSVPQHGENDQDLTVPFVAQQPYKNLCWAACGAMVLQYYFEDVEITDVAGKMFGNCTGMPTRCDQPAWPDEMYKAYGFGCQIVEQALTLQAVRAWIANTQPVQAYYQWWDDTGHTVLIVGCSADDDWLLVYDPLWGIGWQSYQTVLQGSGRGGTWQRTWCNIRND